MEFFTGLIGVFVGAFLSAFFTRKESQRQTKINATLKMSERFQSLLSSRILADQILNKYFAEEKSLTYDQLYKSLPPDDWQHISKTRHFFNELGLLYKTGYLNTQLAKTLFASSFRYWYENYFLRLKNDFTEWSVPPNEIASWLLKK